MKKSLFILTAALSFGFAAAQTADPVAPATPTAAPAAAPQVPALTDVPAGHWAKDAIDRLVERGIILGYPDGTYRGTQNLTRYEAAVIIARLLDQIRTGAVDQGSLSAEDLTALQNAIQELAADLTALGVRVSDLEENAVGRDDFSRLEARVEELAAANGDAAAITAIQAQIAELTARADEYDTLRADIDDNASSIAALNDLTVLLNQDILNLQDRVSAVESAQADFVQRSDFDNLAGRVGTIDTRVTALENRPVFSVVGGLTSGFGRLNLTQADAGNFDVSRLTTGTFASDILGDANVTTTDTERNYNNAGGLTFGVRASNLRTVNGLVTVSNAGLNFGLTNVSTVSDGVLPVVTLTDANVDGTINGQKFDVKYNFRSNAFKFSDYLFNNSGGVSGRGIVANIEATNLPLQPKITVVTGTTTSPALTGANGTAAPATAPAVDYFGIRTLLRPSTLSTVGISYAQASRTAFGVDYDATFGVVKVKGEGVISAPNTLENNFVAGNARGFFENGDKAFYTNVTADLGVVDFGVNYRTIDPAFAIDTSYTGGIEAGINAGMMVSSSMPYSPGQTGFGAALGTNLGPVALGAYADTYTPYGGGERTTGFGVKAGAQLGALELVGFFNRVTVGDDVDGSYSSANLNRGNAGMGIANVPSAMTSTVGAELSHDGSATNALVKNLNFTVGNAYYYNDPLNNFYAYADYSATVAGFTLQPLVRYNLVTDRNVVAAVDESENTVKYGIKLSSATLTGLPLQPSLYANFANRISNDGSSVSVDGGTTTELLGQVGVSFNQFLAPSATAKIGYSYYQGFGVEQVGASVGAANVAFNAADDRIYSGRGSESGRVQGVFAQLGYSGLAANYGVFRYTNFETEATSVAQGFRVTYNFNF